MSLSVLSVAGARRAEILARATKSDTGGDYLKKKCCKESASSPVTPSRSGKHMPPRQGLSDENQLSMSNNDVRDFMKVTEKETLCSPVRPDGRPRRNVAHKFIKTPVFVENTEPTVQQGEELKRSEAVDGKNQETTTASILENNRSDTACADSVVDELEIFLKVPEVSPKRKQARMPARRKALSRAIEQEEEEKKPRAVTSFREHKRQVFDRETVERRLKSRSRKMCAAPSNLPFTLPWFPKPIKTDELPNDIHTGLPIKSESSLDNNNDQSRDVHQNGIASDTTSQDGDDASVTGDTSEYQDTERPIILNIHLKSEDVDENQQFEILSGHWNSIRTNNGKLDRLKNKLKFTILHDRIEDIDVDKVEIEISSLEDESIEVKPKSVMNPNMETPSNGDYSSKNKRPHDFGSNASQNEVETCPVSSHEAHEDDDDMEKDYNVIDELQELWNEEDDDYIVKPVGLGFDCPSPQVAPVVKAFAVKPQKDHLNTLSSVPLLNVSSAPNINFSSSESTMEDEFVDLVSDVDDFEDESEPIILSSSSVTSTFSRSERSPKVEITKSHLSPCDWKLESAVPVVPLHRIDLASLPQSQLLHIKKSPETGIPANASNKNKSSKNVTYPFLTASDYEDVGTVPKPKSISNHLDPSVRMKNPVTSTRSRSTFGSQPCTSRGAVTSSVNDLPKHSQWVSVAGHPSLITNQIPTFVSSSDVPNTTTPKELPGNTTTLPGSSSSRNHLQSFTTAPISQVHLQNTSPEVVGPLSNDGSLFVGVKINSKQTVVLPAREVNASTDVSSPSPVAYQESLKPPKFSPPVQGQFSLGSDQLSDFSTISRVPECRPLQSSYSSSLDSPSIEGIVKSELSNSSWVSNESKSSSSSTGSKKVCSFLFSPKFKARAGIKDDVVGEATGLPVKCSRPSVPFMLKCSLVPKRKSL